MYAQNEIKYLHTKYVNYEYKECDKKYATYKMEIYKQNDSILKKFKDLNSEKMVAISKHHKKNKDFEYWTYYNNQGVINKKAIYKNDSLTLEKYIGKISNEIHYRNGRYSESMVFNSNDVLLRKVIFDNGLMLDKEDLISTDSLNKLDSIEVMPKFYRGDDAMMKFIMENLKYPEEAVANNISGTVRVKFTIDSNGTVKNPTIIGNQKLGYGCEKEAIRVIENMPRWNPALMNGVPISCYFNLPVRFMLF